jgi:hypothetical protein
VHSLLWLSLILPVYLYPVMSLQSVREFLQQHQVDLPIIELAQRTATVALAAEEQISPKLMRKLTHAEWVDVCQTAP